MGRKQWIGVGAGMLVLVAAILVFGTLRVPRDHLAALQPYALWKRYAFAKVQGSKCEEYGHVFSTDLTSISYSEAIRLLQNSNPNWFAHQYATNYSQLEDGDTTITVIGGTVPFEPRATVSVE